MFETLKSGVPSVDFWNILLIIIFDVVVWESFKCLKYPAPSQLKCVRSKDKRNKMIKSNEHSYL